MVFRRCCDDAGKVERGEMNSVVDIERVAAIQKYSMNSCLKGFSYKTSENL